MSSTTILGLFSTTVLAAACAPSATFTMRSGRVIAGNIQRADSSTIWVADEKCDDACPPASKDIALLRSDIVDADPTGDVLGSLMVAAGTASAAGIVLGGFMLATPQQSCSGGWFCLDFSGIARGFGGMLVGFASGGLLASTVWATISWHKYSRGRAATASPRDDPGASLRLGLAPTDGGAMGSLDVTF